jgi:hypothetical protein
MSKTKQHHNRRDFLKNSAFAAIGLGCLGSLSRAGAMLLQHAHADGKGTHNMLVVGEQTVYLSHLPMFQGMNDDGIDYGSPHRYQVILEATFSGASGNLTQAYSADRKSHPTERMYTLNPALFVLPDLEPSGKALPTFRGNTVFRGHLERGGKPIIGFLESFPKNPPPGGVFDVNVTNVVHFHKFVPCTPRPAELPYILFGKGVETFMAHRIVAPPEFDQVISVKISGQQFSDADLAKGMEVSISGRANTALTRLRAGEKASGTAMTAGSTTARPVQVEAIKEFYFEEGELRFKDDMAPTAEEIRSKFGG